MTAWPGWLLALVLLGTSLVRWQDAWATRRAQRAWDRGEAERREAVRHQQRELERQIWLESLPDWQRESIEASDRNRVAIRQEARRRLGLPEEAGDDDT